MSTYYGLRKGINPDELFDGRLAAFRVREEVRQGRLIDSRRGETVGLAHGAARPETQATSPWRASDI
jgi:hypothetical protein